MTPTKNGRECLASYRYFRFFRFFSFLVPMIPKTTILFFFPWLFSYLHFSLLSSPLSLWQFLPFPLFVLSFSKLAR